MGFPGRQVRRPCGDQRVRAQLELRRKGDPAEVSTSVPNRSPHSAPLTGCCASGKVQAAGTQKPSSRTVSASMI